MTQGRATKCEKIYEFEFDITGVTDYGVGMEALLAGKEPGYREDSRRGVHALMATILPGGICR